MKFITKIVIFSALILLSFNSRLFSCSLSHKHQSTKGRKNGVKRVERIKTDKSTRNKYSYKSKSRNKIEDEDLKMDISEEDYKNLDENTKREIEEINNEIAQIDKKLMEVDEIENNIETNMDSTIDNETEMTEEESELYEEKVFQNEEELDAYLVKLEKYMNKNQNSGNKALSTNKTENEVSDINEIYESEEEGKETNTNEVHAMKLTLEEINKNNNYLNDEDQKMVDEIIKEDEEQTKLRIESFGNEDEMKLSSITYEREDFSDIYLNVLVKDENFEKNQAELAKYLALDKILASVQIEKSPTSQLKALLKQIKEGQSDLELVEKLVQSFESNNYYEISIVDDTDKRNLESIITEMMDQIKPFQKVDAVF